MQFEDCAELSRRSGFRLGCLIEHKENITLASCRSFLNRVASLVFSDYRLMGNFLSRCQTDIDTTKCGRLSEGKVITVALAFFPNISCTLLDCIFSSPQDDHSQGQTVECLESKISDVTDECKTEILRIAELQADDYHLNRPLYFACRDDRER